MDEQTGPNNTNSCPNWTSARVEAWWYPRRVPFARSLAVFEILIAEHSRSRRRPTRARGVQAAVISAILKETDASPSVSARTSKRPVEVVSAQAPVSVARWIGSRRRGNRRDPSLTLAQDSNASENRRASLNDQNLFFWDGSGTPRDRPRHGCPSSRGIVPPSGSPRRRPAIARRHQQDPTRAECGGQFGHYECRSKRPRTRKHPPRDDEAFAVVPTSGSLAGRRKQFACRPLHRALSVCQKMFSWGPS
jgi:hypothetical protein